MTQPDRNFDLSSFAQEEIADTLARSVALVIPQLPPITRLRLLAFIHLLERPEAMRADLDIEASGGLRLTLAVDATPEKNQQH